MARHLGQFSVAALPIELARIGSRLADYYISLVGELFDRVNSANTPSEDWAQLGNAFLQFSKEIPAEQVEALGISKDEAALFAAASFYFGDFPASACLAMRQSARPADPESPWAACYDFLARPSNLGSQTAIEVREQLRSGDLLGLGRNVEASATEAQSALADGPDTWVAAALLSRLLARFEASNIRAVLPEGGNAFWTPLINSFIDRKPSTWEFFPSQIQAIGRGLLGNAESYSLQMPTGAGKTTLCETLLYWHLKRNPTQVAIMIVPYRSLASELRHSLVRQLNGLGIAARCAYGGTIPSGDEVHGLDHINALIATPESLSGILSADPAFAQRISLVICDEGHLLDSSGRGIGLELLLARMKARQVNPIRFVFMSAIIPNIEEVNAWLGGSEDTVIRSSYRPAIAEFSVLRSAGSGVGRSVRLDMHPHAQQRQYSIHGFLDRNTFQYVNPGTGRTKTYGFSSTKTLAVAAARKVLPMGTTAIFAANKRGDQGAIGLAEELIKQLECPLPLPKPIDHADLEALRTRVDYLEAEFGAGWIGARSLSNGAVLHHGDIPQETREVLEGLLRDRRVQLVICTSTLAEGVNLPIRSLVLYSVQRRVGSGRPENMLARDIKNLVGRAGRAGANTKGLVICANPDQWWLVLPVATAGAGEPVRGSLRTLIGELEVFLSTHRIALDNQFLESQPYSHPLIDGVDATLIELIAEEIGDAEFLRVAIDLSDHTFAAHQLPAGSAVTLRRVFELRAQRLISLRAQGKIAWLQDTGAKVRLLEFVEQVLLASRADWASPVDPASDDLLSAILGWAWQDTELQSDVRVAFRLDNGQDLETVRPTFFGIIRQWIRGATFAEIAQSARMEVDEILGIHARAVTYSLQTLAEQGVSLLARLLLERGIAVNEGVLAFVEHLKFGAPSRFGVLLANGGVRHRKAYVALGNAIQALPPLGQPVNAKAVALRTLENYPDVWRDALGEFVYSNTLKDVGSVG
ncbi:MULTISPECIES: DEAD/DEAH box helicase [unclassified Pseudomonas]|uniref:DEAD/DEAH box helicase n=1 Tax=unclassified Pseudomonas TaxID=196821 RepID=UPI001FAEE0E7|nr:MULTISPECIES: DEAD/DEAH box helicase [unclassified Pseudomonas]